MKLWVIDLPLFAWDGPMDWHLHLWGTVYALGMASAALLGQDIPPMPDTTSGWAAVVSVAGSLGFSVWFGWYTTTKTIPEMRREHTQTLKELTESFAKELKDERDKHAAAIGLAYSEHRANFGKLESALAKLADNVADLKSA